LGNRIILTVAPAGSKEALQTYRQIIRNGIGGFTLIELIVVISLISILLFFSIPRLDVSLLKDRDRELSAWIILNVKSLKEAAFREQQTFVLSLDLDHHRMWAAPADAASDVPAEEKQRLPRGFRLLGLAYPDQDRIITGVAEIRFYPKGYSDAALIYMEDNKNNRITYQIEPFLSRVKIHEGYVEY
jgi:prepilin-type N-terminal cleavage/methylation domain-containing protein